MPELIQNEIQKAKSKLFWIKLTNCLCENPYLKNNVFFKPIFKAFNEFYKDEISLMIENDLCLYKLLDEKNEQEFKKILGDTLEVLYKQLDEKNEQLDENRQEFRKILGEIHEETNLLVKKFDEDEEGENEKELKNNMIKIFKLVKPLIEICAKMWVNQK